MKKLFKNALIAAALLSVAACGNSGEKKSAAADAQEQTPRVQVATSVIKNVDQTEVYTSTVQAFVKNNIAPQSGGRISKIYVEVGDFVKKGQVVAEMDKTQLAQIELQLKNNEIEYNRLKGLFDAGGLSQSDLDAIEMAYNVSKTNYDNLLENSVLVSPIDGVISARNYDAGDMYTMSQPLYTVEQIVPVKMLVGISEVDYTKVKKGDSVEIVADAIPGKTFYGKVNRIYPTIDPMTRTFTVEVVVDNSYKTLRPGMFVRATVNFGTRQSVVVPDLAIVKQTGSGERFVYVVNADNTVKLTPVKLGRRIETEYEVLEGLQEGDIVVVGGQTKLKSGIKVELVK
ncbi:MAG: efflux RND transporter periplasmic adaptor subunit [Bacteroidales bacterium]|nr:efflux RND transporter periplasmic adaptor subunit [Bacteroidales bacterium]MDD5911470.1 efflux RND transporter periplasmic adaptor subunit [Bacteroidales bacterium]